MIIEKNEKPVMKVKYKEIQQNIKRAMKNNGIENEYWKKNEAKKSIVKKQ